MAVKMIRRNIEQQSNIRPECSGQIELEARQFEHHRIIGLRVGKVVEQGGADIAADKGGCPAFFSR
jgi:hypothetical protein